MHTRIQIASIAFAVLVFAFVFELVRRRRLRERYALVWMAAALVLLVLAIWKDLLTTVSKAFGIYYPPNALFVIAFGFLLLLLLHLSSAVSRLSDQTTVLAQRMALLEQRDSPGPAANGSLEHRSERYRDAGRIRSEQLPRDPEASATRAGELAPTSRPR